MHSSVWQERDDPRWQLRTAVDHGDVFPGPKLPNSVIQTFKNRKFNIKMKEYKQYVKVYSSFYIFSPKVLSGGKKKSENLVILGLHFHMVTISCKHPYVCLWTSLPLPISGIPQKLQFREVRWFKKDHTTNPWITQRHSSSTQPPAQLRIQLALHVHELTLYEKPPSLCHPACQSLHTSALEPLSYNKQVCFLKWQNEFYSICINRVSHEHCRAAARPGQQRTKYSRLPTDFTGSPREAWESWAATNVASCSHSSLPMLPGDRVGAHRHAFLAPGKVGGSRVVRAGQGGPEGGKTAGHALGSAELLGLSMISCGFLDHASENMACGLHPACPF